MTRNTLKRGILMSNNSLSHASVLYRIYQPEYITERNTGEKHMKIDGRLVIDPNPLQCRAR